MDQKLVIASTSFLLPKNKAWRKLLPSSSITFSDYGDYYSALQSSPESGVVLFVIFLQDIISDHEPLSVDQDDLLNPILDLIQGRLESTSSPLVLAFSAHAPTSPIVQTRVGNALESLRTRLVLRIESLKIQFNHLYAFDADPHFGSIGFDVAFDKRNWYSARCRLSLAGINILVSICGEVLKRLRVPRKKVLVLDCDNTLWGGVVGEEGVSGITLGTDGLGAAFADFQRECMQLSRVGVLIGLCSKNEEGDVWAVFDKNPMMILKRETVITSRINWKDKHENLIDIAEELGLDLDSFVFWDDNPLERELVRSQLPMVEVVEVPQDVLLWPTTLANLTSLQSFEVTREDKEKLAQYRSRAEFSRELNVSGDKESFLSSIDMKPRFENLSQHTLQRAHQLINKTNQFNMRGKRYSFSELDSLIANDRFLGIQGALDDRYGKHGIVSVAIVKLVSPEIAFLDTFLMSCRVLGRFFEYWMMQTLVNLLREKGFHYLVAEHISLARNGVCRGLIDSTPFYRCNEQIKTKVEHLSEQSNKSTLAMLDVGTTIFPHLRVFKND